MFDHKNYFDENILDESNRLALFSKDHAHAQSDNSHLLLTLDRSTYSHSKNPEESSGEKRISLVKLAQN